MNQQYLAFLDKRIPELHKAKSHPGRLARVQADKEWAEKIRKEKGK